MARVYLLSANQSGEPFFRSSLAMLREGAALDKYGVHQLTSDPAIAEVILFAENNGAGPYQELCRAHPLARRYPEKCCVFDVVDHPVPFMRGIYSSIEKRYYQPGRTRSGFNPMGEENPYVLYTAQRPVSEYLFSFIGAAKNSAVRDAVFRLPQTRAYLRDTENSLQIKMEGDAATKEIFWKTYADVLQKSLFVICPRGVGASTIRLFETMKMGRVPVIVSDAWVEPAGLDWPAFSLRIAEAEVEKIPEILTHMEGRAVVMGAAARKAWEDWFSPEACFHRVTEWSLELVGGKQEIPFSGLLRYGQFLRPFHFRQNLRLLKRRVTKM